MRWRSVRSRDAKATPAILRSRMFGWRVDWGYTAIYADTLSEARRIGRCVQRRAWKNIVPYFSGYR